MNTYYKRNKYVNCLIEINRMNIKIISKLLGKELNRQVDDFKDATYILINELNDSQEIKEYLSNVISLRNNLSHSDCIYFSNDEAKEMIHQFKFYFNQVSVFYPYAIKEHYFEYLNNIIKK